MRSISDKQPLNSFTTTSSRSYILLHIYRSIGPGAVVPVCIYVFVLTTKLFAMMLKNSLDWMMTGKLWWKLTLTCRVRSANIRLNPENNLSIWNLWLKRTKHSKKWKFIFFSPRSKILNAPFRSNIKKKDSWPSELHAAHWITGPVHCAAVQRNLMQSILMSYEAPFRSNLQRTRGPVRFMQLTGLRFFFANCP